MNNIEKNITHIHQQIKQFSKQYNRNNNDIELIAVSKRKPASAIIEASKTGQRHFAENYLQEALEKITNLSELTLTWHFIGSIQSNKTRPIAENFDWVHTLSQLKHAKRLNDQRPNNMADLNVCIQLNLSNESTKNGILADQLLDLAQSINKLPRLKLRGLMTMPNPKSSNTEKKALFSQLQQLQKDLIAEGIAVDTLSMGMSADMELAIQNGSTMLRIGTAIFGSRDPLCDNS